MVDWGMGNVTWLYQNVKEVEVRNRKNETSSFPGNIQLGKLILVFG